MIIRRNAMHDTNNPPGQIVSDYFDLGTKTKPILPPKKLGDVIDRVRRSEPLDNTYERGYSEGFIDGKKQGFQEGLEWARGKV